MATIYSNSDNAVVNGTPDADTIVVHGSNDTISGFGGDDVIFGVGNDNLIYGDSLTAVGPDSGIGSDIIVGGPGNDTLWGGASADTLQGGGGADHFSFGFVPQARLPVLDTTDFNGHNDLIVDFSQAQHDVIDLSGYHIVTSAPVVFLGTGPFTNDFGLQVRYEVQEDHTVVQFRVPTNGDPSSPNYQTGEIDLAGVVNLTAADFLPTPEGGGVVQPPPTGEIDWNALAAQVEANFAATGHWFV